MLRRLLTIGTGAAALLFATPAGAQEARISQEIFGPDGQPVLVANPSPDGGQGRIAAWRFCPPQGACQPVVGDGSPDDRQIEPGDVAAGTTFEADSIARDGRRTTARSNAWNGRVTATSAPAVTGELRVGSFARPVAAAWTGGWGMEYDRLRLEACRDRTARRCETLSAEGEDPATCSGAAAVLGRRYTGWWVRAVDMRLARDTAFAGVGYLNARAIPLARASRVTVRSQLVGPVLAPRGRFVECAAPDIAIPGRARKEAGRVQLAQVTCTSACDRVLAVRDARRLIRRRVEPASDLLGDVGLPANIRLSGPTVRVSVLVNGRHRAKRTVRLR